MSRKTGLLESPETGTAWWDCQCEFCKETPEQVWTRYHKEREEKSMGTFIVTLLEGTGYRMEVEVKAMTLALAWEAGARKAQDLGRYSRVIEVRKA